MSSNLQETFGGLGQAGFGARWHHWQTVRWLVGLAVVALLLGLGALGAGSPTERTAPSAGPSAVSDGGERPAFDGRGKWTGY